MTSVVDLTDYLHKNNNYADMSRGKVTIQQLPKITVTDGPTWNDRVKRAELIGEMVRRAMQRSQEDLEERFLDLREVLLTKIRKAAPPGYRVEGTKLHLPNIGADLSWITYAIN